MLAAIHFSSIDWSSLLLSENVKIKIYNIVFCCCFVSVWNLVFHTKEGTEHSRRIFGPRRAKATGGWRKLHNEELHSLYSSQRIIRMNKPRRMRWMGYVVRTGEKRIAFKILV
jgi:hypothetical protein